jgi:hypothetical protein
MENAIHPQTTVQTEPETQICATVMEVGVAANTLIQTTKVVPNPLLLGQTCVFIMAEGIAVNTLTTMGRANRL